MSKRSGNYQKNFRINLIKVEDSRGASKNHRKNLKMDFCEVCEDVDSEENEPFFSEQHPECKECGETVCLQAEEHCKACRFFTHSMCCPHKGRACAHMNFTPLSKDGDCHLKPTEAFVNDKGEYVHFYCGDCAYRSPLMNQTLTWILIQKRLGTPRGVGHTVSCFVMEDEVPFPITSKKRKMREVTPNNKLKKCKKRGLWQRMFG